MYTKPITDIEDFRTWMISLQPAHQITDEVLVWVTCQYNAKQILNELSQQDLANLLYNGIPKINSTIKISL